MPNKEEYEYDKEELNARMFALGIAKVQLLTEALLTVIEWTQLVDRYKIKEEDYPGLYSYVRASKALLEKPETQEAVLNNPVMDLQMLNQMLKQGPKNSRGENSENSPEKPGL